MAVYKDKKTGRWYFRVYVTDPITGDRVQRERRGFDLKRDALDAEAHFINNYHKDENRINDLLMSDLIDEVLNLYKKNVKVSTYSGYSYEIEKHITSYYKNYKLKQITRLILENWYNKLDNENFTVRHKNRILGHLKKIFEYADDQYSFRIRYLNTFPNFRDTYIPDKRDKVIYDINQFNMFISKVENQLQRVLFYTLFYSGLRIGELRALTWNDIDFDNLIIKVNKQVSNKIKGSRNVTLTPKSKSSIRDVYIPKLLVDELKQWKDNRSLQMTFKNTWQVFGDEGYITENRIRRFVKKICLDANLPYIRLHEFRHSYTTMLYNQAVDPLVIQSQTGHGTVDITLDVYTHLTSEQKQKEIFKSFNGKKNIEKS